MTVAEELDVKAAIERFVADDLRMSLELPPMAAGPRKEVKAIADAFPSLVAESFGMGADRCIHLFKREASKEGTAAVTIKNGFIDDWVALAAGEDALEPVVFRSMPSQLSEGRLPFLAGRLPTSKLDLSPITEGSPKLARDAFRLGSGSQPGAADGSPLPSFGQPAGLPTLLGSFQAPQVRNTFVHFDTAAPSDDRSVQSMPHDMFRQCLEEEAAARLEAAGGEDEEQGALMIAAKSCPAPKGQAFGGLAAAPGDAPAGKAAVFQAVETTPCEAFPAGTEVTIQGLTKIPAFNGQRGLVERLDGETGRYSVRLTTGGPGIPKLAKVKAANLCLAARRPTLLMASPPPAGPAAQKGPQAFFGQYSSVGTPLQLTGLV